MLDERAISKPTLAQPAGSNPSPHWVKNEDHDVRVLIFRMGREVAI